MSKTEYTHIFSSTGKKIVTIETPMSPEKERHEAGLICLNEFMNLSPEKCSLEHAAAVLQFVIKSLGFH